MSDLKQLIEEYDRTGELPVEAKNCPIDEIYKFKKITALLEIAENVKETLKEKFKEYGNLEFIFTTMEDPNGPYFGAANFDLQKNVATGKNDLTVNANFNLLKIAQLPGFEAFSVMYYPLYNSILKEIDKNKDDKSKTVKFGKEEDFNKEPEKLDPLVKFYLDRSLKKIIGNEIKITDYSVDNLAKIIQEKGIFSNQLFDNQYNENLLAERYAMVSKQGHQQQAEALLGEFSKDEFAVLKNGSDDKIRDFCERFANKFLQNSGLEIGTYDINFSNTGDLGTYSDSGTKGQSITINLEAVREMDNPAEVLMTLTHELTHMVDSSVNKGHGQASRKGFGLEEHNMVGGVSEGSTGFLREMEEVYYKVNPHERSARQGELVALEFMNEMQTDETMKSYVDKSLVSFQNYQIKTIETIKEKVEPLIKRYQSGEELQGYDDKTKAYIDNVMADLIQMKYEGLLDFTKDLEALKETKSMGNQIKVDNFVSSLGE